WRRAPPWDRQLRSNGYESLEPRRLAGVCRASHRAHQFRFDRKLTVDCPLGLVFPDAARVAQDFNFHLELVTWFDRPLEAGAVNTDKIHDAVGIRFDTR